MPKIVKKAMSFKKVEFGAEGYLDLSEFTEVASEASKGEIGITDSNGTKRVRLGKNLFAALEEPVAVKVLSSDTQVAFKAVPEGTSGAYNVCKCAVIYAPKLAETIMAVAGITDIKENSTKRCGNIVAVQSDENGAVTVILNFG